jgi:gamma-glutamylcyclotransferase (GGCT)/AIG2-like uncharacterized protein YtfP
MFAGMRDLLELVARATTARRHGRVDDDAERLLDAAFGCCQRLAVYGTLAPGEANADQLADCPGTWSQGMVTGRRAQREHPVLTFDASAGAVPVLVLHSEVLPAHWARLDAFEGDDYHRILVPVARSHGSYTVANLYEAVRIVGPPR